MEQLLIPNERNFLSSNNKDTNANYAWNLFGAVFDNDDSGFSWTQDGFFNALNSFPEYGWAL